MTLSDSTFIVLFIVYFLVIALGIISFAMGIMRLIKHDRATKKFFIFAAIATLIGIGIPLLLKLEIIYLYSNYAI